MCCALRFDLGIGMVSIDAFQVCFELLPNFYDKNPTAFCLTLWWKSNSALPQMRHNTQNAILTMILMWEYGNGNALFSRRKFGIVSRLVRYGAFVGVCVCVYGAYWQAGTMMSRSPSKHQACCIAYIGKPISLSDMDQDNHTAIIVHTV